MLILQQVQKSAILDVCLKLKLKTSSGFKRMYGSRQWKSACVVVMETGRTLTQMVYSLPSLEYPPPCQLPYPPTATGTRQLQAFTPMINEKDKYHHKDLLLVDIKHQTSRLDKSRLHDMEFTCIWWTRNYQKTKQPFNVEFLLRNLGWSPQAQQVKSNQHGCTWKQQINKTKQSGTGYS